MEIQGLQISFRAWDTRGAAIKAPFDTTQIVNEFHSWLWQYLIQKGLAPLMADAPVVLQGRFIRIDQGNRALRYFLMYTAGQTVIEVEGELISGGKILAAFYAKAQSTGLHMFGGEAEGLLKNCARQAADLIAKQVVEGIRRSSPETALPVDAFAGVWSGSHRSPRQWVAVCEMQMQAGAHADAFVPEIIRDGYPQTQAETWVGEALSRISNRSWKTIGCSALLILMGILFTVATASTASSEGQGSVFIWFGAVVCGIVGLIYGIRSLTRPREKSGSPQVSSAPPAPAAVNIQQPVADPQVKASAVELSEPVVSAAQPPVAAVTAEEQPPVPLFDDIKTPQTADPSIPVVSPVQESAAGTAASPVESVPAAAGTVATVPAASVPAVVEPAASMVTSPPVMAAEQPQAETLATPPPSAQPGKVPPVTPVMETRQPPVSPGFPGTTPPKRPGLPVWAWVLIGGGVFICLLIGAVTGLGLAGYLISRSSSGPAAPVIATPAQVLFPTITMEAMVPPFPIATDTPAQPGVVAGEEATPTTTPAAQLPGSSLPALAGAISPENVGMVSMQAHTENEPNKTPLFCNQVAWFPDNQRIAVAGNEVHIFDFRTKKEEVTTTGLQWVDGITVFPDGKTMALYTRPAGILLWDVSANVETRVFAQEDSFNHALALSPDGTRLVATTQNGFTLYDVATGQKILAVPNVNGPYQIAFSPDGKTLAGGGAELKLWNAADGSDLGTLSAHSGGVNSLAFSPDGKILAAAFSDSSIKIWDAASGNEITTLLGHTSMVSKIHFSPDGRLLASLGRDKVVRLWDMSSGKELGSLAYESDTPSDVRFSPDGTMIAACGSTSPVMIWGLPNSNASQPTATWSPPTPTVAPANAPQIAKKMQLDMQMGSKNLAWRSENQVLIGGYGIVSYNPLTNSQVNIGKQDWVFNMALSPDGSTLAATTFEALNLIAIDSQSIKTIGKGEANSVIAFSPDGTKLAASINEAVKVYDTATGNELNTIPAQTWVQKMAFTPDGKSLAVIGSSKIVLFDVTSGAIQNTLTGHIQTPNTLAFSPDGKILAVGGADGSEDGKVVFWDATNGQWLRTMTGHANRVTTMAFSPDGRWLVTGSADLTLRVWDVTNGTLLVTLTGHTSAINAVAFSPDQKSLVSGGDHEVIFWTITPKE